ncbi:V-type ATPase subunit [Thiorhodococcus mannitoliphagus]|uniref:V-type ATPase subunit n=1 Tax=Thiorhodococcus mannitoliphagus TaxID=329406 RepID=A0A6P1DYE6_9GAMM|nr:V-type ATPase subunit [Thiorhodococcus mannitoliphagus]NEX22031.1 V-type ATPase subunit [Thiorhodococcus mannitoliphagus]
MSHVADQAYLSTLVSAMSTRLFDVPLMRGLSQRSLQSLSDAFGLAPLLDDQPTNAARSRAIEQSLIHLLLTELRILIRPMNADARGLVLDWGRKYGLSNLKTLIRGKLYDLDPQEIRENLFELPSDIHLSGQELLRAENVLELLRQLEAGPHRHIARQAREVYEQQRDPFALEAAIDQRYYVGLVRRIMAFSNDHLASLRRLLGAELDRIALLWLLRFRFCYQLSPSETYYWLVPSMRLLTRERLLQLVNLETFEQVLKALPEPLDAVVAESKTIAEVQQRIGRHTSDEMRWVLARSQSGVARALAYLMLRETDLMLLFAAVQGQLLQFPETTVQIALELIEPTCAWDAHQAA